MYSTLIGTTIFYPQTHSDKSAVQRLYLNK